MKGNRKRWPALLLTAALVLGLLSGCGSGMKDSVDLMEGVEVRAVSTEGTALDGETARGAADFALRLFQASLEEGENTLVSPVSVLFALSMTANGARGETLAQMEEVLGLAGEERNLWLRAWWDSLPEEEQVSLTLANAIWFTDDDRFTVNQDFLQTNADYYGAGIYRAPFDQSTVKDINSWVREHTDGMIRDILDQIPPDALMYLVNALAFDAKWQSIYREDQIHDRTFTTEAGEERQVELMYSQESDYLVDQGAVGVMKNYAGGRFAFAALLPEEGTTVAEYAASLTGERLAALLSNPQGTSVTAAIPKFETESALELSEVLAAMGMADAFDADAADFSGLGASTGGNIFISRVLHKTYIAVDEQGTRAGAATAVEADDGAAGPMEQVILDRPFLYMIVDRETNLPLFIGAMMDPG